MLKLIFRSQDGFNGESQLLAQSLNDNYFKSFKGNEYQGELVPANRSGFTLEPSKMHMMNSLTKQIQEFNQKINLMREKAKTDPEYQEAVTVADTLVNQLNNKQLKFKSHLDLNQFKRKCLQKIEEARPILEHHRDFFSSLFFDNFLTSENKNPIKSL